LSSAQVRSELVDALLGIVVGDTRDVNLKQNGMPELTLKVTAKAIKQKELPPLNDEFAKDMGVTSMEELQTQIKKNLESNQRRARRVVLEKQVDDALLLEHPFPLPPSFVKERSARLLEQRKQTLLQQGGQEKEFEENKAVLEEKSKQQAEHDIRLSYIFSSIIRDEKIGVTDQDIQMENDKVLQGGKMSSEWMEKFFRENNERIRWSIMERKVYDLIINNTEVKPNTKVSSI